MNIQCRLQREKDRIATCKIPYPRAKMWIKYNLNFPPREVICGHGREQKYPYP